MKNTNTTLHTILDSWERAIAGRVDEDPGITVQGLIDFLRERFPKAKARQRGVRAPQDNTLVDAIPDDWDGWFTTTGILERLNSDRSVVKAGRALTQAWVAGHPRITGKRVTRGRALYCVVPRVGV